MVIYTIFSLIFAYFLPGYLSSLLLFEKNKITGLFRLLFSFAFSVAITSSMMLLLGQTIGFSQPLLMNASLIVLFLLIAIMIIKKTGVFFEHIKMNFKLIYLIPAVLVFFSFYHALLFPESSWDGLYYHGVAGRAFYEVGGIPFEKVIYNSLVQLPAGAHVFYTWFYEFNGFNDIFARLMSPMFFLASLVLVYLFAGRLFDKKTAEYSVLFFSLVPIIIANSMVMYTDLIAIFLGLFSVFLAYLGVKDGGSKYFALAGLMGGFATLVKTPSFLFPLIIIAFLLYERKIKEILIYLCFFTPMTCLWYLRSLLLFSNPFYPLSISKTSLSPLDPITFIKVLFFDTRITYSYGTGPLALTFGLLGLLFLKLKQKSHVLVLSYLAISLLVILAFYRADGRAYMALYPAIAILCSIGFLRLRDSVSCCVRKIATLALAVIVLFSLSFSVIGFKMQESYYDTPVKLVAPLPMGYEQAMTLRFGPVYSLWKFLQANTSPIDKILSTDTRIYYHWRFTYGFDLPGLNSTLANSLDVLKGLDVKYVVVVDRVYHEEQISSTKNVILENLNDTRYFEKVFEESYTAAYKIK
jgi:hypothetical protein